MKIFRILMMGMLIMDEPAWGQNYLAPRDSRLGDNYNELELRDMPDLPKYAPRPKTQQDVVALFKKGEKENDEYSNYALFSLISEGCFELGKPYQEARAEEECNIANYFLLKTLEINPNNVVALYYSATKYKNGYGVKKDILKAIDYYDKAYRIGGNKIFAAIDSLFVIYFYGKRGVQQDLNKA